MRNKASAFFCFSLFLLFPVTVSSCGTAGNHIIQPDDKNIVSISVDEDTVPEEIFIGHFDEAGIKLIVTYSDDTIDTVSVTRDFIPEVYQSYLDSPGTYTVTLLYKEKEVSLTIKMVIPHYSINFYAYVDKAEYTLVSAQDIKEHRPVVVPDVEESLYIDGIHYTFTGWDKKFDDITQPLDIYAQYGSIEFYVVTFYNGRNEVISTQKIDKGDDAIEPTEEERYVEDYVFIGWDRSYLNVREDLTINGLYVRFDQMDYTITWENYDGTVLDVENYRYGETPTYKWDNPTRAKDAQYTYTFSGWSPEISEVTGNQTYVAQYDETVNEYTITWKNYDDSVITTETYSYGETPTFKLETPTKPATEYYTYTFSGWSPEISEVTGNQTYVAQFTDVSCFIYTKMIVDGQTVISIEGNTFIGENLVVPSEIDGYPVYRIWYMAFANNQNIRTAVISEGITYIDRYIFYCCSNLESVVLPNTIDSIPLGVFQGCGSLQNISIPDTIRFMEEYNLNDSLNYTEYNNAYYLGNENNPYLVLAKIKPGYGNLTTYDIHEDCQIILDHVFKECRALESITIGNKVRFIGCYAFEHCDSLTSIVIPDSVKEIRCCAFIGCDVLSSVTIGSGITYIDEQTFRECANLSTIAIGSNVTAFGPEAFRECTSLTTITIPKSVTSIRNSVFYSCNLLETINYEGTMEEWNRLELGEGWNYNVPATAIHCSDGDINL